jgi:hypothetical protein
MELAVEKPVNRNGIQCGSNGTFSLIDLLGVKEKVMNGMSKRERVEVRGIKVWTKGNKIHELLTDQDEKKAKGKKMFTIHLPDSVRDTRFIIQNKTGKPLAFNQNCQKINICVQPLCFKLSSYNFYMMQEIEKEMPNLYFPIPLIPGKSTGR